MSTLVIGSGIIGLTTAIRLLESSPSTPVHIIASRFPSDASHPEYASTCAGAHHLSFAADDDARQARWDRQTFEVMQRELDDDEGGSTGLMSLRQTEYFDGQEKHLKFLESYPDFRITPSSELPEFATHSVSFRSITMTPSIYLSRLTTRFLALGGKIHTAQLASLSSSGFSSLTSSLSLGKVTYLILCIGLGASSLPGLEDKSVFPTRGQVVKVRAPWVKTGWTRQVGSLNGGEGGKRTYVIPRGNGEVILGGTRDVDEWQVCSTGLSMREVRADFPGYLRRGQYRDATPDPETTRDILLRALEIYPAMLASHPTSPLPASSPLEDKFALLETLVEDVIVGHRPSRQAGPRVERGLDVRDVVGNEGEAVKVFYNYGHGGAGWQACWGAAEEVNDLVMTAV